MEDFRVILSEIDSSGTSTVKKKKKEDMTGNAPANIWRPGKLQKNCKRQQLE